VSSYWDSLEKLLAATDGAEATADAIIQNGWAPYENRTQLIELLAEHQSTEGGDGGDYDYYCECGKWLEWDIYDMPDHVSSLLEDADLLTPGRPWTKRPGGSK
jgi:hypothetical protein